MSGWQGECGATVPGVVLALSVGGLAALAMRAYLAPDFLVAILALDFLCR